MKKNWILYVASRYIFNGRGNSPVLSVLGIAFGVLALIVIIAVMNGFQLGFIESILEISSYHLRLENVPKDKIQEVQDLILSVQGIKAVVLFKEYQALARGKRSGQQVAVVRGLPENAAYLDKTMSARLDFTETESFFDISKKNSILLGNELSRRLGLGIGDDVTLFSLSGILSADEDDAGYDVYKITGIFRTNYYEYDCSWAFINIENDSPLMAESDTKIGIKIANRFQDKYYLEQVRNKILQEYKNEDIKFSSWRDYNRSFFGALRTEKLFMFILVGLIFIVVGLNIFQSQRRSVLQRREEIGLLRAVGGSQRSVRFVFVLDGAIIGLTGASIGLVLGLLTAFNIQKFFTIVETIVNAFIKMINIMAGLLGIGQTEDFAIFSTAVFYIKEIPSRVLPEEVIFIFLFGFLSALFAAWFASKQAVKLQPAEVLYET